MDEALRQYADERDEAFIEFVKTGNYEKVAAFSKKYHIDEPADDRVREAGIYKAVQYCTRIPEEIKHQAAMKCLKLGFSPIIAPPYAVSTPRFGAWRPRTTRVITHECGEDMRGGTNDERQAD